MIDNLKATMVTAASAIEAQQVRLRVASENLANAQSTGNTPGANPYARKTVSFASQLDEVTGANRLVIGSIQDDDAPFRVENNPSHPAADEHGNVKLPNVNVLIEMADMRETNRSYEANLQVVKQARELVSMTIDLLRSR